MKMKDMNVTLLKNANIYAPHPLGVQDILIGGEKILAIGEKIDISPSIAHKFDLEGRIVLPGFIDQHIHLIGAGGKYSFSSMTPEIEFQDLINCGSTTVVGLLGTDGSTKSLQSLYAKVKGLEQQGISAYMFTNYYGYPTITLTETVKDDMIFIDKILGCKIAISDIRSSYPTTQELARLITQIYIGGMVGGKKGILHLHLGNLKSGLDQLFELVEKYHTPIEILSPTHVGRTKDLFDQSLIFAKKGGMIDITTGASKYDLPWKQVKYALDQGVSIDQMTFSTDGNAGLSRKDEQGNIETFKAPIHTNLEQVIAIVEEGVLPISEAFKLITTNPAKNLGLPTKGTIQTGNDADFCTFDHNWNLIDVIARGQFYLKDKEPIKTRETLQHSSY